MTNSHDRVALLEEVVDASTLLLSFFAAERIEMKSTTGYLIEQINDYKAEEGIHKILNSDVGLSVTEEFLTAGLQVSEEQLKQSEAQREAAEQNVTTLQQAVKDHVKQEQVAEEKIAWLEKELERTRQDNAAKEATSTTTASTDLELIKKQTTEIDKLRKELDNSRELHTEATTDLEQTRAALVTARREADESAQQVEVLTRQVATGPQGEFSEGAERDDQLSDVESMLSREMEQLREKIHKIHIHLTRALRKFEDDPDMTIRAIDSALKLARKA